MASKMAFDSTESQNWLRQWKAVFVTRTALLPSVKSKASHLHNGILQKASNEQTCSSDHSPISDKQPIHCRYHEKLRNEINAIHKRKKPSWRNASTDTWRDSEFAVAKLFMQQTGYDDKSSFDEIDFNGLAAFIYNCGQFTKNVEILSDESRHSVKCELSECKIEDDLAQLQVEMENKATLQRMDPRPISTDYTIYITLSSMTMAEAVFRRVVSMVIQSRHSVEFEFSKCKIEPEEDVTKFQVEMENQVALQRMDPRPVSTDYTIDFTLSFITMSATVFRHFVTMVIQSGHFVKCKFLACAIEPERNETQLQVEIENQAALQRMNPRPVSTDYTIDIKLFHTTMSAAAFRRFVSLVKQSRHSVKCELERCRITPKQDVRNLIVEMKSQAALTVTHFVKHPYKIWDISFLVNVKVLPDVLLTF
ncbi:hypothetical protein MAR_006378 [Mya arenaria]|uniref:Uncharacterized protein n=1 Tax=Mya arenaria TaxID=6604 RepID=A0ABY7D8A2_MYAAR|nr:hypothetical protein MAR_006378 [Mya arenaria]